MHIRTRIITFFLLFLINYICPAQVYYQPDTTVKVYAYGAERPLAWCGGFNNPQFAMADLNHDGKPDLVVFENWNSLRTFLNVGTEGVAKYQYAPEYALTFPPIFDYVIMADYNRDGVPDLFEQGQYGFAIYKGYYDRYNRLSFTFYENLFYSNDTYTAGTVNAFNNPGDIPAIVDVDGDGDLDFISYYVAGGWMYWYKNMQVEDGLPPDSVRIELADRCWGRVYQGYFRTHTIPYSCDNSHLRLEGPVGGEKKTHQGNTPCLFDYDMDGDYDYLDGSISFNEMTFLKNGRIPDNPTGPDSMVYQDTLWQSAAGGTQIEIPTWPAAFNLDIDQDGKKDILVAPNGSPSENYHCIWFYKNYTTPGSPDWRFQSDSFLIDQTIDCGTASYPVFFDYNKDGKPDLLVGSDGYFQPSTGNLLSRLSLYENTSTTGSPSLTLQTTNLMALDTFGFKGLAPAVGDIDNDGKTDLVVGHSDGTLSYFKNMAASDSVTPNWQLSELVMRDVDGNTINVDAYAAPFIYDIDRDGKKDLLIGNTYGTIQYYQNVSTTPGTLSLKLITTQLGGVKVDADDIFGIYSAPFIGKIDSTGIEYLMVGSNSGNIYRYTGFQTGDTSATYTMLDSNYNYIDSTYNLYNHPGSGYAYYSGLRSTVTVADIGGSGAFNMIVGNNKGGLQSYTRQKYQLLPVVNHTGEPEVNEQGSILLYPNPANEEITVSWSGVNQDKIQVTVINMEGQIVSKETVLNVLNHKVLNVSSFPAGMYICLLQSGVNRYYNKFTVVR